MDFSVIIPCHNVESTVRRSIESVFAQTHPASEIIVVDDASTDGTRDVLRSFGSQVRVVESNCRNGAGSRNRGVEAATGDWLAFLDSDDAWRPAHLERYAQILADAPPTEVGILNRYEEYLSTEDCFKPLAPTGMVPYQQPQSGLTAEDYFPLILKGWFAGMSSCGVRRRAWNEIGGMDEAQIRRHDIEMWFRLLKTGTWSYDPQPTVIYTADNPNSISRNIANREYFMLRAVLQNRDFVEPTQMQKLLAQCTRRALSAAWADGEASDRQVVWPFARAHANLRDRLLFGATRWCPQVLGGMIRRRRL